MAKKDATPRNAAGLPDLVGNFSVEIDDKAERVSLPPFIPPRALDQGNVIGGEIIRVMKGQGRFKQEVIHLRHAQAGDFCFPATKIVKSSLSTHIGVSEDDLKWEDVIGTHIAIRGIGKTKTKDGKRTVNRMEVFITKKGK